MGNRTRLYPRDLSEPEPLKDHQVEGLRKILSGYRALFQVLDDVLPTGEAKEAAIVALVLAKRAADETVRLHQPRLTFKRLAELFAPIEIMDRRVSVLVVNIGTFSDMRAEPSLKSHFDLESSREEIARGLVGHFMGVEVYVNKRVPLGHVSVIAEDEGLKVGPEWAPASLEKI